MAGDRLRAQMDEIRALRDDPVSDAAVATLRTALAKRPSHVVALAADHAAEHHLRPLGDDLVRAYDRLAAGGVKTDPGCTGKAAVVKALSTLDHPDPAPFLHGVGLVQLEKAWGKPVDTAIHLRGHALMALVGLGEPGTPLRIADALSDPEGRVRAAAVRAAVAWGDPDLARALIALRLGAGEQDTDVLADAFEALIRLGAVDRVVGALDRHDERAECAALALGAARIEVGALIDWWRRGIGRDARRVALVAIGLTRSPEGLGFLIERLGDRGAAAEDALEALAVYLPDPAARARIEAAAAAAGLEVPEP